LLGDQLSLEENEGIAAPSLLGDGKGVVTTTTVVVLYPPTDCETGTDTGVLVSVSHGSSLGNDEKEIDATGFVAYFVSARDVVCDP
jgi:hypothetical protein